MDKDKVQVLKQFIAAYKAADDKEAFISMWEAALAEPDIPPLTLQDAYDEAYGDALAQYYALEEGEAS